MYNQPYFIPSYYSNMAAPTMMRGAMGGAIRGAGVAAGTGSGLGLFSRLGNRLSAIRGINWSGFITNASKTLGVINQTIPLVRQVGPMFNNMRSMLRIASIFKDETDKHPNRFINSSQNNSFTSNRNSSFQQRNSNSDDNKVAVNNNQSLLDYTNYQDNDSSPTFFIES